MISIKLKGFDSRRLDQTAANIVKEIEQTGAMVKGPIPLQTKWVYEDEGKPEFEHVRLVYVSSYNPHTIESMNFLEVPKDIKINIRASEDFITPEDPDAQYWKGVYRQGTPNRFWVSSVANLDAQGIKDKIAELERRLGL